MPKTTSKKAAKKKGPVVSKAKAKKKAVVKKKIPSSSTKKSTAPATKKKSDAKKKPVAEKATAAKKGTAKKVSTKKAASKKVVAKKVVTKKAVTKKTTAKKSPSPKSRVSSTPPPAGRKHKKPVPELSKAPRGKPLNKTELKKFKKILLELRERLQGDIRFLTTDNLHRSGRETGADLSGSAQHSADHGTDNFDREFALSLASTEQDVLYEVDEALMRIHEGTYGICEMTGVQIERARLQVIPYTRYSVQAQSKMEQSRAKYRPFAQTFKGW